MKWIKLVAINVLVFVSILVVAEIVLAAWTNELVMFQIQL